MPHGYQYDYYLVQQQWVPQRKRGHAIHKLGQERPHRRGPSILELLYVFPIIVCIREKAITGDHS